MLAGKLVRSIEGNWETLAGRLIRKIRRDPGTHNLAKRSDAELREWVQLIVENLTYWLGGGQDEEVRRRYEVAGRARFEEGLPLDEAVLRFHMLKDVVISFIHEECVPTNTLQVYAEEELERRIDRYFDSMVYYIVRGYEGARRRAALYA
ncbi:MAG: hypothetical protein M1436_07075 [Acidobacteria bacterium]|nr:hypothetical protein [Acidobacteriota bacterium]